MPEDPNRDYYYILRETGNTEPILIEYGFIDNENDVKKLKNNLNNYAEAVVKAITEYTGYFYEPHQEKEELAKESYIVQKGDTLYSISKKTNIPIEMIKRINNLKDDTLLIGQELYFVEKALPIQEKVYTIKRGDTLYSIAREYNTTVEKIKELNKLSNNILSIGQELILPISEEIEEVNNYSIYTVKKGDSLWKIAKEHNIQVDELIDLNNLTNLTLQINQKLLVPQKKEQSGIYIVQKGETLWSIAKANNLEVNILKEINNLTNNLLTIGQELKIKN